MRSEIFIEYYLNVIYKNHQTYELEMCYNLGEKRPILKKKSQEKFLTLEWSRRESNPRPAKINDTLSTCLFDFNFREGKGNQQT